MALGQPYAPTASTMDDTARLRRRTPVQQALQTLSLRLPKVIGAGIAPGALLQGRGGGGGTDAGAMARMAALVRAMTGGQPAGPMRPGQPSPGMERPRRTGIPVGGPGQRPAPRQTRTVTTPGYEPSYEPQRPGKTSVKFAESPAPEPEPVDPTVVGGGYVDQAMPQMGGFNYYTGEGNPYARNFSPPRFARG